MQTVRDSFGSISPLGALLDAAGVNDANREWRNDTLRAQGLPDRYYNRPLADMLDDVYRKIMGYGIHRQNMYISNQTVSMMIYALMTGEWQRFMTFEEGAQSNVLSIQK